MLEDVLNAGCGRLLVDELARLQALQHRLQPIVRAGSHMLDQIQREVFADDRQGLQQVFFGRRQCVDALGPQLQESFNSTLVRLRLSRRLKEVAGDYSFQFHFGSIKTRLDGVNDLTAPSFNSTLVRLRRGQPARAPR